MIKGNKTGKYVYVKTGVLVITVLTVPPIQKDISLWWK